MIVCQCNIITVSEIEAVVDAVKADNRHNIVTPGLVFDHYNKTPNCGTCMDLIVEFIQDHLEAFHHKTTRAGVIDVPHDLVATQSPKDDIARTTILDQQKNFILWRKPDATSEVDTPANSDVKIAKPFFENRG